jgi:hypothetical protein
MRLFSDNSRTFRMMRDMIDVTSLSRPDPSWRHVDAAGHAHQWYVGEHAATAYKPDAIYHLPTTELVQVGTTVYEDDVEETPIYERRCVLCGVEVTPGTRADDTTQFIAGMTSYYIDDERVSKEEFDAAIKESK